MENLPIPLYISLLVLSALGGLAFAVFSEKLKHIPTYAETVIHESGHVLSGIVLFGGLARKIDFLEQGEAKIEYSKFTHSPINTYFTAISGYGFSILFGISLCWMTLAETIKLPLPAIFAFSSFVLMMFMGRFLIPFRAVLTITFLISMGWLLLSPDDMTLAGEVSALTVQALMFSVVGIVLISGSWRHVFSFKSQDSGRTAVILIVLFLLFSAFYLLPAIHSVASFLIFMFGIFLIASGVKVIVMHNVEGEDFWILADEFGGSATQYFIQFLILFPVAFFILIRVLCVLTMQ